MNTYHYDVIVVGAGPAGSMAARAAAEGGVEVAFIEEHQVPGKPVYCAEGLSIGGIRDGGLEPTPDIVRQQITCARVYAPSGETVDLTSDEWTGYVLDREIFDKSLADNAVEAGAELFTNTLCKGIVRENENVVGVNAESDGELYEFRGKVVIGADGHWSVVRRSAGLKRYFDDYVSCAQYQLGGLDLEDPSINEFWMGRKYAPGGYAWVFPKSEDVVNIGLGVRRIHDKPAIDYLDDFIDGDPRFREGKILKKNGGICPVCGTLDKIVDDGLMLAGDSAGQLIPMTGAGIHSGIEAGKMAGRVAAEAVKEGDVSAERLYSYRVEFDEYWGKRIRESRRVLDMLDKFSDEDLNTLAQVITNEDVLSLANGENVAGTITGLVRRSPRKIIRLIRAYLR
ncbi:geranylgeranyl reductase family protein [Candidatus Bathyarchaeota archaeon]|nr:geranylgeranyl reductase family protein [Candidatus Bathyarchaeota archaeon]